VKAKQEKFKALMESRTEEEVESNKVQYKTARKEAKKAVAVAKNDAYKSLYQKLDSKGGDNEVFRLARARERQSRDISTVRCIKDEDGRALVEEAKVQERWQGISVSFLMEKVWRLMEILVLSMWLEKNNKTTDHVSLSPERRLRRH